MSRDPYLESIRGRPEFKAIEAEIGDVLAVMQDRAARAEATGDRDQLRELAERS